LLNDLDFFGGPAGFLPGHLGLGQHNIERNLIVVHFKLAGSFPEFLNLSLRFFSCPDKMIPRQDGPN
jgi:hypothetical protein